MKFKKFDDEGDKGRQLELTDMDVDTLRVSVFEVDERYPVTIEINEVSCVGLSRSKALKLAWAIINELDDGIATIEGWVRI